MYCNNCGKHNPEKSKFCKYCGAEIVRVSNDDDKSDVYNAPENNEQEKHGNKKAKAGLHGWLTLVGLGLIAVIVLQGYGLFEYFDLFTYSWDEIPGYLTLLQIEFFASIIIVAVGVFLLVLYFKKSKNFPNYYIYFLIASVVYVVLDHLFLASLSTPTQEMQTVINDTLSENTSVVGRTIIVSTIWALYIKKSKQVKATFTNE